MNEIIVALIGGAVSVLTCVITIKQSTNKMLKHLEVSQAVAQAVTDEKLAELTREVREHNNFAKRMPVVENEIKHIEDEIHKLEQYHK